MAVEAVAFTLGDEEPGVRRAAVRALGAMRTDDGAVAGIDHLLELVKRGDDEGLLVSAVNALGAAGDPRALEVLAPLVSDGAPMVAVHAVEALGDIPHPRRAQVLGDALGRSDSEVVKAALQMLVDKRELDAETHLAECLEHPEWEVRRLAADLAGRFGGLGATTRLRRRLGVEVESLVREALYRALAELEGVDVVVRRTTPPPTHQR